MAAMDATATADSASLPYYEPAITQILVMSSFLLLLNTVNSILDRTLYCGLIGQVLVGIAWGTPGAQWLTSTILPDGFETAVVQLGYLGLILLVYEGGVSTSIAALKANLVLAAGVAATGIAAPMALSFVLGPLVGATPLQSFAAGAALCSTSLGTTFTVLSTSGLVSTRLGSVLSTAAMMDDVVGLVMVQIVSSLGSSSSSSSVAIAPITVVRPVLVSLAFAVVIPLANRFVLRPAMRFLDEKEIGISSAPQKDSPARLRRRSAVFGLLSTRDAAFAIHTTLLLGLVSAAAFAGASVLLAAYLAGIMVCWWDAERKDRQQTTDTSSDTEIPVAAQQPPSPHAVSEVNEGGAGTPDREGQHTPRVGSRHKSEHTGIAVYEHYYSAAVGRVLKPFFFASIGFSIPITKMFSGAIVWRGIIYTLLMLLGKLACGLWLVRLPRPSHSASRGATLSARWGSVKAFFSSRMNKLVAAVGVREKRPMSTDPAAPDPVRDRPAIGPEPTVGATTSTTATTTTTAQSSQEEQSQSVTPQQQQQQPPPVPRTNPTPAKPTSLYPAGILSFAMVARGEIGFLISAVAESKGVFHSVATPSSSSSGNTESLSGTYRLAASAQEPSDIFLIVTWAIVLCTIIGPLVVGILVKRVKRLEVQRRRMSSLLGKEGGARARGGDEVVLTPNTTVQHPQQSMGPRDGDDRVPFTGEHEDHVLGVWGV
ncbi:Sodium/hydrogen exchanger family-domain-containing protein [Microdochium trichocladiopsis]|uniref:Sodium/hydrogen exchanger family-domain-containing protein n=1 Tax=Microdochium trichocladiopsis TaxID=1682393 RepID=A0A9P9BHX8_9PEZI|nr:Sodium/hydrogen exchanger family-domain-containing protein [Microdochium trichocladiopsis]KAH7020995.1 Sodium/hydrogen exchanger family-domain-containing protein [Microdochium trichocladiopsis]